MNAADVFLIAMVVCVLLCLLGAIVGHVDNLKRIKSGDDPRLYVTFDQNGQSLGQSRQKRPLR